jgi:hypothetical protein
VSGTLPIGSGGTGLTGTPTNGQLLIGNGTGYSLGTLTASTGISVTDGSGSITIANSGVTSLTAGTNITVSASTGSVTIGTTATPTWTSETVPLISGGTTASSTLTLQSTSGAGTSDAIIFRTASQSERMRITTAGDVGIGVNSPGAKLDVVGPSVRLGSQVAGNPFSLELRTFYETCSHTVGAYGGYTISSPAGSIQITGSAGGVTIGDGSTYLSVGSVTVSTNANVDMGMQQLTCGPINSSGNLQTIDIAANNINANDISALGSVSAYTTVSDGLGDVRTVPQNSQGSAYTLTSGDAGKYINITTGGVTVATSTALTVGQSVSIYNDSGSNQTITQGSSVTMYLVGTATTGNRTLAQRGLCTIFCVGANTYVITGGGLT